MAKKSRVRDYDQFIVRLPEGMRDRIKAKADLYGISMNEAVVSVLNRAFPPPATMEEKLSELVRLVATLRGDDSYHLVDVLVDKIDEALEDVAQYKVKARPSFRNLVADRYSHMKEEETERLRDLIQEDPFYDELVAELTGKKDD